MPQGADTSGSFQRPTLVDYLLVLEHESIEVCLHVHVGTLEVGIVGVRGGAAVHAQLPGAAGNSALQLIGRLPNTHIRAERWTDREENISSPWRQLISNHDTSPPPGRRQRLSLVRAELRELDAELAAESGVYAIPRPEAGPVERKAMAIVGTMFDWAALDAYLEGDIEGARAILQRRSQIDSNTLALANLERVRLRILDDELAAEVAEVSK